MKGITRILVLLVFIGATTGAIWSVGVAQAAVGPNTQMAGQIDIDYETADDVQLTYQTAAISSNDSDGDPDSFGDGLGVNGGMIGGFDGCGQPIESDDDAIVTWEGFLAYLWSIYFLTQ